MSHFLSLTVSRLRVVVEPTHVFYACDLIRNTLVLPVYLTTAARFVGHAYQRY